MSNKIFVHSYGEAFREELVQRLVNYTLFHKDIYKIVETQNRMILIDSLSQLDCKFIVKVSDISTKTIVVSRASYEQNQSTGMVNIFKGYTFVHARYLGKQSKFERHSK